MALAPATKHHDHGPGGAVASELLQVARLERA